MESGTQEPRLRCSVGTGGQGGAGAQVGREEAAETRDSGDSDIRDAAVLITEITTSLSSR